MNLEHFLPPKIHSNFNSSNKITNFFVIPIISIDAPLKINSFAPNHVGIAYSVGYGWFYLKEGLADTFEAITNDTLMVVEMAHAILVYTL